MISTSTLALKTFSEDISSNISANVFDVTSLNQNNFPRDFVFGTSTSAYQYEGGAMEDGKEQVYGYLKISGCIQVIISWSRILPNGRISGGVNQEGITYYNDLLANALEDEYGGFLSPLIVFDFRDYAELCFKEFGDRVKYWITINEPSTYTTSGYAIGMFPPGRCSDWQNLNCTGGI
ncbi:unnamed protein product [Vicia faba]|uniref:Uncharacterized protein n=1 Tax=Vicia faba TaxID=3906 RepID=A0AAV0YJ77_VICFA|nr:unnamed protein product [Vicia faba]